MTVKRNYEEIVRVAFADAANINQTDIDNMHTPLWIYKTSSSGEDLRLDFLYAIEKYGKFRQMHLITNEWLKNICTMDDSLASIAKKMPKCLELLSNKRKEERKIRETFVLKQKILNLVLKMVTNRTNLKPESIDRETSLMNIIDSLDIMELMVNTQKEFNITFTDAQGYQLFYKFSRNNTVGVLVDALFDIIKEQQNSLPNKMLQKKTEMAQKKFAQTQTLKTIKMSESRISSK